MAEIESVWENAPGRYDENGNLIDKWVGVQMGGVRKTQSGYVKDSWWYFLREFPDKEARYWYRKMRMPAKEGEEEGKIVEEYIGRILPFTVPPELSEPKWGVTSSGSDPVEKE